MFDTSVHLSKKIISFTSVTMLLRFLLVYKNRMIYPILFKIYLKTITLITHLRFRVTKIHFKLK